MGNAQSSRSSSEPMRITKPRTNRSSTNLLLRPPEPAYVPSSTATAFKAPTLASHDDAVMPSMTEDHKTRKDTRQRSKNHMFNARSDSSQPAEGQSDGLGAMITGLRDRLSRSGSSVSRGSSTRCSSMMASCPGDSRLALPLEPEPAVPPLPVQTTDNSEPKSKRNGHSVSGNVLSYLKQVSLERPDMSSLRRRSMFTPGVATRTSTGKPLPDQPPPMQTRSLTNRDYFSEKPSQLELRSMLTALDLAENSRGSGSPGVLRVGTPSDIDYSHLGCFKPGTLRITNGAASPIPSMSTSGVKSPLSEQVTQTEEYFSARPGRSTLRATTHTMEGGNLDGPLNSNPVLADGRGHRRADVPVNEKPLPKLRIDAENGTASRQTDAIGKATSQKLPVKTDSSAKQPDRTSIIAQEYKSELPSSPFLTVQLPSLGNWTLPTFEDEGFASSPTQLYELSAESEKIMAAARAESREDALRTLTGTENNVPATRRRLTSSSAGSQAASLGLSRSENQFEQGKPLAKSDSGYSSSLSLKSLYGEQSVDEKPMNDTSSSKSRATSSIYTFDVNSNLTQPKVPTKTPPPLPPKASLASAVKGTDNATRLPAQSDLPSHPTVVEETPPLPPKPKNQKSRSGPSPMPLIESLEPVPARTPMISSRTERGKGLGDTMPLIESLESGPAPIPIISSNTEPRKNPGFAPDTQAQRPSRKLHKSPPASNYPVTVQGCPEVNDPEVPPVPSEVVARHAGRFKRPSALAQKRSGTLNSSDSADHSGPNGLLARVSFPWITDGDVPAPNEKESSKEHRRGSIGLISRTVRRYKSDSKLNIHPLVEEPEIMPDLEMVIGSLGSGPYDVAMSNSGTTRRHQNSHDIYPHQIGRLQKSTRTTVGMDNKAAALLARQRSKDIAESRSRGLSRPHSFGPTEFDEQGDRLNGLSRRKSLLTDAPPVPSLPAVHRRGNHSAITANRLPNTLVTDPSTRKMSGNGHRTLGIAPSGQVESVETYKRTRRQHRKMASAELLGRYQGATSLRCHPIIENPLQESGGKSKKPITGKRYPLELSQTHGLDRTDVPISVQA